MAAIESLYLIKKSKSYDLSEEQILDCGDAWSLYWMWWVEYLSLCLSVICIDIPEIKQELWWWLGVRGIQVHQKQQDALWECLQVSAWRDWDHVGLYFPLNYPIYQLYYLTGVLYLHKLPSQHSIAP